MSKTETTNEIVERFTEYDEDSDQLVDITNLFSTPVKGGYANGENTVCVFPSDTEKVGVVVLDETTAGVSEHEYETRNDINVVRFTFSDNDGEQTTYIKVEYLDLLAKVFDTDRQTVIDNLLSSTEYGDTYPVILDMGNDYVGMIAPFIPPQ